MALNRFSATESLMYNSIYTICLLIASSNGNIALLVITDRLLNVTSTVLLRTKTSQDIFTAFTKNWRFLYSPASKLLASNKKQFTLRFLTDVCRILASANLFTITYHPQTNGQGNQFSQTLLAALHYYVAKHPRIWGKLIDALTYECNTQPHSDTSFAPTPTPLPFPPPP